MFHRGQKPIEKLTKLLRVGRNCGTTCLADRTLVLLDRPEINHPGYETTPDKSGWVFHKPVFNRCCFIDRAFMSGRLQLQAATHEVLS
jgi:hypothetical protein